jgi:hypothetical protein
MVAEMTRPSLIATALAAALVAAATVLAFAQMPDLLVWAAFIGWASYDHSGADRQAAVRSSACLVFGVIMAWVVALIVAATLVPLTVPVVTAIVAGIASFAIVTASRAPLLREAPATFYGFASTFAYLSLTPGALTLGTMTTLGWHNAVVPVSVSLLIGTALGAAHGWLADFIAAMVRPSGGRPLRVEASHESRRSSTTRS